jgi:hypothetical protein
MNQKSIDALVEDHNSDKTFARISDECEGKRYGFHPRKNYLVESSHEEIVRTLIDCSVVGNLRILLTDMRLTIDSAIPNKDQNRALRAIVEEKFNMTFWNIAREAHPEIGFRKIPNFLMTYDTLGKFEDESSCDILAEDSCKNLFIRSYVDSYAVLGYDYVIGVYLGDLVDSSIVSVWRKGTKDEPLVQAAEYEITGDGFEQKVFNICTFLAKKYGKHLPDGPMFSIEQVTAPGDTLLHQLKLAGFIRHCKMASSRSDGKPKEGWHTTAWSRPIMVERFLTAYKENQLIANSALLSKCIVGAELDGKKLLIPNGDYNRFMAAAIAVNSVYSI